MLSVKTDNACHSRSDQRKRDFVSDRAKLIPPSGIRRFFDLAGQMEDVISLGVGEPDYSTPWHICDAAITSIEQGHTAYTSNTGMESLRNELSRFIRDRYQVEYNPKSEMIVTTGVSEGLDIVIRAVTNPGDEVLVIDPSYVSYAPCVTMAGGTPVPVPCTEKNRFRLSADVLMEHITPQSKVLVLNFPNNPTGGVMRREDLETIADVAIDHDLLILSDEVYAELTYEGHHTATASIEGLWDRTITLSGFSKAFAMTGWRLGYICAPHDITAAALKIHQYVMLSAPTMSQYAALEALKNGEEAMREMVREYHLRRNLFVDGLNRIGLSCHTPEGAFYAFPSVKGTGLTDYEFAERLITEAGVAVVPGSVFGAGGIGHVRCSYAVSRQELTEAIRRMDEFIRSLP
ncbi:aminotransferase class I/II-fold pyridoxal phosphate-dependent enzyme [Methanospirillum sp. J.3.6.1-F.2.7.3]|jgi:Aspartate/tyrosine/aromatic aminotransferase|uniref:Aminotransferase n=2 Tax=Methanospirillum TaxID=2202 RepID=A0A8E7EJT6_9EURY|nr:MULTISPECIES: aminotransferase class I/II-fold pyridoxal phosphate-dependent enzyme [Methanospirillum]MDX8549582.1 aminotransferase class I/II-fold pyridoxal phosphate-dependent enzyme [Methanospirillum hungatei]NLW75785.1 aminotransferase class I/II-fold pyridoxal phosphate-dependent enzyme [Methanomicrobiales archaeon]QVV88966.1 aminotransferase class I/II-fold pyridoxal phosphate-dependent enzyme [Methanospirillum sp. J.3.6.1-F.2.7.3]QXO93701.1 aminotransferase class I/II-fold pyridoxal p